MIYYVIGPIFVDSILKCTDSEHTPVILSLDGLDELPINFPSMQY